MEISTYIINALLLLKMFSYGWFVSSFEIKTTLSAIKKDKLAILDIPVQMINCVKCATFWITIIYTGSFDTAVYAALLAYVVDAKILGEIKL